MPELNALSALALARTTGCKVRPKGDFYVDYHIEGFRDALYLCKKGDQYGRHPDISAYHLTDSDGNPIPWEIVPDEGATL